MSETSPRAEQPTSLSGWQECGGVQIAKTLLRRANWLLGNISVTNLAVKAPVAPYMNCLRPSVIGEIQNIPRACCRLDFVTVARDSAVVRLHLDDPNVATLGRPLLGYMPSRGEANSYYGDPESREKQYTGFTAYVLANDGQAMMLGQMADGRTNILTGLQPCEVVSFIGACHLAYSRYRSAAA